MGVSPQQGFRTFALALLELYIGSECKQELMNPKNSAKLQEIFSFILQNYLADTMKEVKFIYNELILLRKYFDDSYFEQHDHLVSSIQFFAPPKDSEDLL